MLSNDVFEPEKHCLQHGNYTIFPFQGNDIVNSTSPASFKKHLRDIFVIAISYLRYVFTFASNCSCKIFSNFCFFIL